MRSPSEVLKEKFKRSPDGEYDPVLEAMEEYAKEVALEFFKFNAMQISAYMDYLRRVDMAEGGTEKLQEIDRFEIGTISGRYELFKQQSNEK